MSKKQKLVLISVAILLGLTVVLFPKLKYVYAAFQKSSNNEEVTIFLSNQDGELNIEKIAQLLLEKGIISSKEQFELVGNEKQMNARNIAPGKYVITPGTAFRHLWNGFKINSNGNGNAEQTVQ